MAKILGKEDILESAADTQKWARLYDEMSKHPFNLSHPNETAKTAPSQAHSDSDISVWVDSVWRRWPGGSQSRIADTELTHMFMQVG